MLRKSNAANLNNITIGHRENLSCPCPTHQTAQIDNYKLTWVWPFRWLLVVYK